MPSTTSTPSRCRTGSRPPSRSSAPARRWRSSATTSPTRTGALGASDAKILAAYGLRPQERLHLAPFFAPPAVPRALHGAVFRSRFASVLRDGGAPPDRRVLVTRGEAGLRLLPLLERLAQRPPEDRPLLVYEMHRLAHVRELEKGPGRRAEPADLGVPKSRMLREREARVLDLVDGVVFLTAGIAETLDAAAHAAE